VIMVMRDKFTWLASIVALVVLVAGCSRRMSSTVDAPPTNPASTGVVRARPVTTNQEAIDYVRQQPDVVEYEKALKAQGYKLYVRTEETPSRFIVRVGEETPDKVTVVSWYLVSKGDGSVTEWDISKGEPPRN